MLRKGKQFLLHVCHPWYYSCYKPGDKSWMRKGPDCDYDKHNISVLICDTDIPYKSWMRKGPDCDYDKHNISVLICDTDIPYQLTKSLWWPYNFRDDFYLLLIIGSVTTSGNKSWNKDIEDSFGFHRGYAKQWARRGKEDVDL